MTPMDEKIDNAGKDVLAEIVKLAQKRGMEGTKGGWKEFLKCTDKKFGANLSDPSKRSVDILSGYLKTFTKEDDLKFIAKILQWYSNQESLDNCKKKSPEGESPEQRLVRLTLEHPDYPSSYTFPSHEEEWMITKLPRKLKSMRSNKMLAVDCEMVLCEDDTEALVRVCVVDRDLKVKLNQFIKPNKAVVDYRTSITGITATDLDAATWSLADVQKSMMRLLSRGTILVGHSLDNDLKALKLDHARVIDTSCIFKYLDQPSYKKPSLNNLCKSVLGYDVRKIGAAHNCLDDACAAMKLVLAKIERGVDDAIPMVRREVSEVDMAKLLLHRVPINVPVEELQRLFPDNLKIERQPFKRAGVKNYSALACFKSLEEANLAFESVKGDSEIPETDTSGLAQKLILFKLSSGETVDLFVRKMVRDESTDHDSSKKRPLEDDENSVESIKLQKTNHIAEEDKQKLAKPNQCLEHEKEIEILKQLLKLRDDEISVLHKIIANLTRKQGL